MGKKKNLKGLDEFEIEFIENKMKGDSALNYLTSCGMVTQLKALSFKLDIKCKNEKQKDFFKNLKDLNCKLNICDAPAGVGKSLLALTAGLYHLKKGNVSKIIVIVPTVEASEATKIGLLPGSIEEKTYPFQIATRATIEKILKLSGNVGYKEEAQQLISGGFIEFELLSYARGRTFDDAFIIIDEAEKMTPAAQNALLKTIEEPPEYVVIMLLSSHEESFLQTILSRCITLRLRPLHDRIVTEYLMQHYGMEQHQASICAAFARGNLGRAITLADSERFMEMHGKTIEILKSIYDKPLYQLLDELKEQKDEINEVLDTMKLWYRDVVVFKATQDSNLLIFKEEQQTIKKMADHSSFNGLDEIQNAIDRAQVRLKANVGFDLTAELLLLTLQEN